MSSNDFYFRDSFYTTMFQDATIKVIDALLYNYLKIEGDPDFLILYYNLKLVHVTKQLKI